MAAGWKPRSRNTLFVALCLILFLLFAGASYEAIATSVDAARSPEPGRLVDIGGLHLMLHCTGKGSPTIVLEAGLGDSISEWKRVQPELAAFARVCSYNRAGYGGSDPGPMPRTSSRIAGELHALLQAAGEAPPYLLVGASFGGYNVRVFHGKYPREVAGMLLVDATQEDQYRLLPRAWSAIGAAMLARYRRQARWSPLYIGLGIPRIRLRLQGIRPSPFVLQSKFLKARASELEQIRVSAEQARAAGTLGDKPLVVLTAGRNSDALLSGALSAEDLASFENTSCAWRASLHAGNAFSCLTAATIFLTTAPTWLWMRRAGAGIRFAAPSPPAQPRSRRFPPLASRIRSPRRIPRRPPARPSIPLAPWPPPTV